MRCEQRSQPQDTSRHGKHQDGRNRLGHRVANFQVHGNGADHEHANEGCRWLNQSGHPETDKQRNGSSDLERSDNEEGDRGQTVGVKFFFQVFSASPSIGRGGLGSYKPDVQQADGNDQLEQCGQIEVRHDVSRMMNTQYRGNGRPIVRLITHAPYI